MSPNVVDFVQVSSTHRLDPTKARACLSNAGDGSLVITPLVSVVSYIQSSG